MVSPPRQHTLFEPLPPSGVAPAVLPPALQALVARWAARPWSARARLGTSSWHFPGWQGWVWRDRVDAARLSREGLAAYARHPLLRTVSLDRAFYRAPTADDYRALAAQVPPDFGFVVKAPAALTDAVLRAPGSGAATNPNPHFLSVDLAGDVAGALAEGLGGRDGVLVLQISPLPGAWARDPDRLHAALAAVLQALRRALPPTTTLAVEWRDAALLTPALAALLRAHAARHVLGLHARMPPVESQLPLLRATWPGPLVCRWNLQAGLAYDAARERFAPFATLQAPDTGTRQALARVALATARAGQPVWITVNNKAEGCAPASVWALAEAMLALDDAATANAGTLGAA